MTTASAGIIDVFLGLDVGTQGVRAVALDGCGDVLARAEVPFSLDSRADEQPTQDWVAAAEVTLRRVAQRLASIGPRYRPVTLAVSGTSGTVVPFDDRYEPLHPALMYSDPRSATQASRVSEAIPGLPVNASWGLPKLVWFRDTFPDLDRRVRTWRHVTDVLVGWLTGQWDVTDETSALKTGYDIEARRWPPELESLLGIRLEVLPAVVPAGTPVGTIQSTRAGDLGLPDNMIITTGMTDGCASQVAAGATRPGDWSTTMGTTLVVKGVTRQPLNDPLGRFYTHRHPDGYWMPGGASNTGADWVARDFARSDLIKLNRAASDLIPTGVLAWPLSRPGERFPFVAPTATGFEPTGLSEEVRFTARLEGVAAIERCAYDLLEELCGEHVECVYSAGGGSRSDTWLAIRSTFLRRPIVIARHPDGAVGAAIVGASQTRFGSLIGAADTMVQKERTIEPISSAMADAYDDHYQRFRTVLAERGFLAAGAPA